MERVSRREAAYRRRVAAAQLARDRPHEVSVSNGEEGLYRERGDQGQPTYSGNFTKGLPHDSNGRIANPDDYIKFVRAIDSGLESDIRRLPLGPKDKYPDGSPMWRSRMAQETPTAVRGWESMAAGNSYSIEGPDSHAVAMPPAPTLRSPELAAEMAEIYLMALLRDLPFNSWTNDAGVVHPKIQATIDSLNELLWFSNVRSHCLNLSPAARARRRRAVTIRNLFRGITPGTREGPYLSQFLIAGSGQLGQPNNEDLIGGNVSFGAVQLSQKVRIATPHVDYLTDFNTWLDAQDGADFRGRETYEKGARLIVTPRDLCTYVHYDALYQAYLTACLIMLANKVPFDPGLPFLEEDRLDKQSGFATHGGPHILSLVTEVATRALKAIRYQKYNIHRRLRPEAVSGLIDVNIRSISSGKGKQFPEVDDLVEALQPILCKVEAHNQEQNMRNGSCNGAKESSANGCRKSSTAAKGRKCKPVANTCGNSKEHTNGSGNCNGGSGNANGNSKKHSNGNGTANGRGKSSSSSSKLRPTRSPFNSHLLPMAFPEGSPMHCSYGAGHACVAAACVTILKAFFDSNYELKTAYEVSEDGSELREIKLKKKLKVGHELNKLAENISIGRNWAGVHYFSDYIESFKLGEKIAIGILEEQKLLFEENFYWSIDLFDGTTIRI